MPEKEYTDSEGTRKWSSFLSFTEDVFKELRKDALDALEKHLEGADTPATPPDDMPPDATPLDSDIPF